MIRLAELVARLRGEIRDRQVNVVNLQVAPEIARMAEVFLLQRQRAMTI